MAREFDDESTQYLNYAGAVAAGYPYTFAGWFYKHDNTTSGAILSMAWDAVNTHHMSLYLDAGNYGYVVLVTPGQDTCIAGTSIEYSVNTWQHLGGWLYTNAGRLYAKVYLDGGNTGTHDVLGTAHININNSCIGRTPRATPISYMDGAIAEVGVWDVILADAEMAELASGMSPLGVRPQSLTSYWPLIRDTDNDIVGPASMTDAGGPTITAHPPIRYPVPPHSILYAPPPGIAALELNFAYDNEAYWESGVRIYKP